MPGICNLLTWPLPERSWVLSGSWPGPFSLLSGPGSCLLGPEVILVLASQPLDTSAFVLTHLLLSHLPFVYPSPLWLCESWFWSLGLDQPLVNCFWEGPAGKCFSSAGLGQHVDMDDCTVLWTEKETCGKGRCQNGLVGQSLVLVLLG